MNLSGNVDANPPANLKWFDTLNPKIIFSQQPEFRLSNIQKDFNNRVYQCLAENEIGRSDIDEFRLNVLYQPRIKSESENQVILLGRSVELNCVIDANPKPTINWYHLSLLTGDIRKVQTESSNPSILLIKNVTYADEGDYSCEGFNRIKDEVKSVRSRNINVKVYGKPAPLNVSSRKKFTVIFFFFDSFEY